MPCPEARKGFKMEKKQTKNHTKKPQHKNSNINKKTTKQQKPKKKTPNPTRVS